MAYISALEKMSHRRIKNTILTNSFALIKNLATVISIRWFSGPYIALCAEKLYALFYHHRYGDTPWYHPRTMFEYVPTKGHISQLAYTYGPDIVCYLLLPILLKGGQTAYRATKQLLQLLQKKEHHADPGQDSIEKNEITKEMMTILDALEANIGNLKQAQNSGNPIGFSQRDPSEWQALLTPIFNNSSQLKHMCTQSQLSAKGPILPLTIKP